MSDSIGCGCNDNNTLIDIIPVEEVSGNYALITLANGVVITFSDLVSD